MRRCLVVDDNEAFAENLAEILRDAGHEVVVAHSGASALDLARRAPFDLLLTDMKMPEMGGAALVHEIRRLDPGLAAIVITAYTNDDELDAARRDGLLAVFSKPLPVPRLLELVAVARRDALITLVEDDVRFADNLCEILRAEGFSVVTAATVLETQRLAGIRPFMGVVDLRVPPGPDGEAMRRLAERFPGLPLVVVTAFHGSSPPVACEEILEKPVDPPRLLRTIEGLHARARHG